MSDLAPSDGARYLLELVGGGEGAHADYRVAIVTAEHEYRGTARLADDGGVELAIEAPDRLRSGLEMFARLTARGAAHRRDEGLEVWPARVLRWRPLKDDAG